MQCSNFFFFGICTFSHTHLLLYIPFEVYKCEPETEKGERERRGKREKGGERETERQRHREREKKITVV